MDVLPGAARGDVPFYSHEIDAYWNDIGNLDELRQGNFDALRGEVTLDSGLPEVEPGVHVGEGTDVSAVEIEGPALFGPRVTFGTDVRIDGPMVVGAGSRIGDGSRLKETILLPGTELAPGTMLAGGIAAPHSG